MRVDRSEVVAAHGVGVGIGLIALMLTWVVGSRLAELAWDAPVGPVVALSAAVVVGVVTSIVFARRLAERARRELSSDQTALARGRDASAEIESETPDPIANARTLRGS